MPKVSAAHLAARRQQIADAAARLFAERGFARTTMADVVSASGLSMGAVYRYFPSKNDLVLAVVARRDGPVDGQFPGETPTELLIRLAGYIAPESGAEHARLVTQIWGDAAVLPDLAAVVRASHQRLQAHLSGLIAADGTRPHAAAGGTAGDTAATAAGDAAATAQVALAALIGMAALVSTGIPVDTAGFTRVVAGLGS